MFFICIIFKDRPLLVQDHIGDRVFHPLRSLSGRRFPDGYAPVLDQGFTGLLYQTLACSAGPYVFHPAGLWRGNRKIDPSHLAILRRKIPVCRQGPVRLSGSLQIILNIIHGAFFIAAKNETDIIFQRNMILLKKCERVQGSDQRPLIIYASPSQDIISIYSPGKRFIDRILSHRNHIRVGHKNETFSLLLFLTGGLQAIIVVILRKQTLFPAQRITEIQGSGTFQAVGPSRIIAGAHAGDLNKITRS